MENEVTHQLAATAEKLSIAAESLDRVLGRLDAQQESLNAKVDRIVAAVEEQPIEVAAEGGRDSEKTRQLEARIAELEKSNGDLKAQATRMTRKTLSPLVTAVLSKNSVEGDKYDSAVLDKTLQALSVEQRIAVKAEMARAGMIG